MQPEILSRRFLIPGQFYIFLWENLLQIMEFYDMLYQDVSIYTYFYHFEEAKT